MKKLLTIVLCLVAWPVLGQFNFYFGNLHSHSGFSDGNVDSSTTAISTPGKSYFYAKQSYQMDFLGISDHNHFTATRNPGMRRAAYSRGLQDADTSNLDGAFIAYYGMEWGTISTGGHLVTMNVPGLIGWETGAGGWGSSNNYDIFCARGDYASYWNVTNNYPQSFSTLAHPQSGDFGNLFASATPFSAAANNQIVGLAIRSGSAFSTTTNYTDPAPTSYESVYLRALSKGYRLGPTCDHDNHYTNFGRTNQTRTVLLAPLLTRADLTEAYRSRRFYASDDWNTQVYFNLNGFPMGSENITTSNSAISVTVFDPDAASSPLTDATTRIEVFFGVPGSNTNATVLTSVVNSDVLTFNHPTNVGNSFYYFLRITQADGDRIWTAPIWINRINAPLPVNFVWFNGRALPQRNQLQWQVARERQVEKYVIERSINGRDFVSIGELTAHGNSDVPRTYQFTDSIPARGQQHYRIRMQGVAGDVAYSSVLTLVQQQPIVRIMRVQPNPVQDQLVLRLQADEAVQAQAIIYNMQGREMTRFTVAVAPGENMVSQSVSRLAKGQYILVLHRPNEKITETRFLKQ